MNRTFLAIMTTVLLIGCTIEGEFPDTYKHVQKSCVDFRDGETFSFNTANVTKIRVGIGTDSHFTFVDDTGKTRTLSAREDEWVKCKDET